MGVWDAPAPRDFSAYCADMVFREKARHANETRSRVPTLRSERLLANATRSTKHDRQLSGYEIHSRMKQCFAMLDSTSAWRRTPTQVEFHEIIMEASLGIIYESEMDAELGTILAQNNWTYPLRKLVALAIPRRNGKSTAMAMLGAVCAITNPGRKIAIFSVTDRQSKLLHASCLSFVEMFLRDPAFDPDGLLKPRIIGDSKNELRIEFADGRSSYINSYPASTDIRNPRSVLMRHPTACMPLSVCLCLGASRWYMCAYVLDERCRQALSQMWGRLHAN